MGHVPAEYLRGKAACMFSATVAERRTPRLKGLECKIASSIDEWRDAFALVHDSYLRAGLSEPRASGLRVTPYHLLPTTSTLIARYDGDVVGTLTLICDSERDFYASPRDILYRYSKPDSSVMASER